MILWLATLWPLLGGGLLWFVGERFFLAAVCIELCSAALPD